MLEDMTVLTKAFEVNKYKFNVKSSFDRSTFDFVLQSTLMSLVTFGL